MAEGAIDKEAGIAEDAVVVGVVGLAVGILGSGDDADGVAEHIARVAGEAGPVVGVVGVAERVDWRAEIVVGLREVIPVRAGSAGHSRVFCAVGILCDDVVGGGDRRRVGVLGWDALAVRI